MCNYLKMTNCILCFFLLFQFICLGFNDRDPRTCETGKNPGIKIEPWHLFKCFEPVNRENEIEKGIKEFPYSNYINDYSREALEKLFPVDPQWEEWYLAEKQGKLPKNIRIVDRNCWVIMHELNSDTSYLANHNLGNMLRLINYKNDFKEAIQNGLTYYQNELLRLEKEGGLIQWYEKSYVKNNPFFFPLYLETIKNWDELKGWKKNLRYQAYSGIYYSLLELNKHPYFFSSEMNALKKQYSPVLWNLYNNPNLITKDYESQNYNKLRLLTLLYLLGEDFDKLIEAYKNLKFKEHPDFYFNPTIQYWDIVNGKIIEVCDIKFKPYFEERLYSKNKSVSENALIYFYDIGELGNYLNSAIEYCYENIKNIDVYRGFDILKLLICWRNDERVEKLAYYYLNHIKEFTYDLDREIKKKFLIEEFGLQENKASEITKKQ